MDRLEKRKQLQSVKATLDLLRAELQHVKTWEIGFLISRRMIDITLNNIKYDIRQLLASESRLNKELGI